MITLTGGQFQDASGNLLKKGYLSLQLTQDAAIIAGGQIIRNIPLLFPIANGSLSGSTKIYSNAELTGSTQYLALVLDANQKRVNDPQVWQFTQGTGATVDLGTMTPVSGGVVFAAPVLLSPTAIQKILNFSLELAKTLILDGSTSGSTVLQAPASGGGTNTLPSGAGVLSALSLAQNWTALQQFSAGISGDGTHVVTIPNLTDTLAVLGTFAAPPALGNTTPAAVNATTLTTSGLVTKYNNISTVSNGLPSELALVDTTGLTANVGSTLLYAVPASGAGLYMIAAYTKLTTAGSVSSTIPQVQVLFTDADDSGTVVMPCTPNGAALGMGQSGGTTNNTVNLVLSGVAVVNAKASTNINYQTSGYASNAAGMTYTLHIKLIKL